MSYLTDITARIVELDRWQRASVAAMCAESVLPIIERFAQEETRRVYQRGLEVLWKSTLNCAVDSDAAGLRSALDSLPESSVDDSNSPSFKAMIAVSLLAYALDVLTGEDSARPAIDACTGASELYGSLDTLLTTPGTRPVVIDPRNPPSTGRLELHQVQSQFRSIEAARTARQSRSSLIEDLQRTANQLASEIKTVLPLVAEKRSWDHVS